MALRQRRRRTQQRRRRARLRHRPAEHRTERAEDDAECIEAGAEGSRLRSRRLRHRPEGPARTREGYDGGMAPHDPRLQAAALRLAAEELERGDDLAPEL